MAELYDLSVYLFSVSTLALSASIHPAPATGFMPIGIALLIAASGLWRASRCRDAVFARQRRSRRPSLAATPLRPRRP